jgi:type I restriction enzyme S subunit
MQKYPTYKDSGVEWLGEIPEYWEILKGKWLFVKEERPARKEDGIVTCFRDGEVTLRTNRKTEGFTIALKEHGYQGIRKGDLVIHNMDAFAGAIGISDSDGKSTPVYSACTSRIPNKVNSYYYAYFLKNLAKSGFIESLAKGIRERSTDFRFNDFGLLLLSVPPLPEQTAIADFLDRKTALIDQAIGIKHKQIDLLKERRQILIHKAVTRGLNPNVKMKDSGVEWIGEIPEHWVVKKLTFVTSFITCGVASTPTYVDSEIGKPFLSAQNVRPFKMSYEKFNHIPIRLYKELTSIRKIVKGDLLMTRVGAGIGDVAIFNEDIDCAVYVSLTHIRVLNEVFNKYIMYFLGSYSAKLMHEEGTVHAGGQGNLNVNNLRKYRLPLPKIDEQKQIVEYIETSTTKIATAISLKEQEIEKLKEYKATLINSAVTGKIKVC